MISQMKKKLNVQEVADILGIYRGTVINYEKKGIFPLSHRNPINGYREYIEEDVEVLRKILEEGNA
ncbi:MAG: MerR family DNA-binding transcriptional regulator [Candidatus Omnitrophica bacterium]|nr:MerR family DNA-binding transcriptional regulator [Candidatus Omnitrophota bacterium]MBU1128658.1 MerR family DNA-binding transcriptional regulator [Candidatus Omnitrophota bacterium]MBU1656897.1 MerR family DNA-binding transcriptional regulator [Candidatus Omnitrophota bacterium]MBU1783929.1 MerR family DNA-binding transcriptional regulator [Candidatus Omnitrophota bacterium]MBU1852212.1 MerR family DNA-binding transcriptional regulator [Candidatus Omnitrophota bacterium]